MKTLFAFFAILGIAGGILAFCFFSPVIAAFALFLYLLVGGGFVFSFAYNHGLRKKWLADPILPDSPEFDDFFWKLTLVNQDWYIEEILHREGLLRLIEKCEAEIVQTWQDTETDREEKIERNDRCLKRLKVLTGMLDFNYGLSPY